VPTTTNFHIRWKQRGNQTHLLLAAHLPDPTSAFYLGLSFDENFLNSELLKIPKNGSFSLFHLNDSGALNRKNKVTTWRKVDFRKNGENWIFAIMIRSLDFSENVFSVDITKTSFMFWTVLEEMEEIPFDWSKSDYTWVQLMPRNPFKTKRKDLKKTVESSSSSSSESFSLCFLFVFFLWNQYLCFIISAQAY